MFNFKAKISLKIIFLFSLIALISAYFIEHFLGHQPCNLCLIQRIPYWFSIIFISILFLVKKNEKFFILLIILTFIFSFAISLYHFGIEQGFFQESAVCGVENFSENFTKEELLNKLSKKTISCKDVTSRIFGLSLTNINMVVSILFIITLGKLFINYEKNKQ